MSTASSDSNRIAAPAGGGASSRPAVDATEASNTNRWLVGLFFGAQIAAAIVLLIVEVPRIDSNIELLVLLRPH
jgi:hypothetical protein